jgi:hypothetical protein
MDSFAAITGWIGTIIVALLCVIVALKCFWTLGLPYAMLRTTEERGWSIFPLIEFIPLVFAILIAWATHLDGWFSPKSVLIAGFVSIALSYIHFFLALLVAGCFKSIRTIKGDKVRQQKPEDCSE